MTLGNALAGLALLVVVYVLLEVVAAHRGKP